MEIIDLVSDSEDVDVSFGDSEIDALFSAPTIDDVAIVSVSKRKREEKDAEDGLDPEEGDEEEQERPSKHDVVPPPPYPFLNAGIAPMAHQVETLAWMRERELTGGDMRGGILELKMGLGKTFLGLVNARAYRGRWPTLVVAPLGIVRSWEADLQKFFRAPSSTRYLMLHGDFYSRFVLDSIDAECVQQYDFVITTYEAVNSSFKLHEDLLAAQCMSEQNLGRNNTVAKIIDVRPSFTHPLSGARGLGLLHAVPWHRLVMDESPRACNPTTLTYKALMTLHAPFRWCLTGTIFQNGALDYWAQFRLLGYQNCPHKGDWKRDLRAIWRDDDLDAVIKKMDYEAAGVVLPTQHETTVVVEMAPAERALYEVVEQDLQNAFTAFLHGQSAWACVLSAITAMRLACIAPCLYASAPEEEEGMVNAATMSAHERLITDRKGAGGYKAAKIVAILTTVEAHLARDPTHKIIVFSTYASALRLLEEAIAAHPTLHVHETHRIDGSVKAHDKTQRDGRVIPGRVTALAAFQQKPNARILLLSGKVGGQGLTITEATAGVGTEPHWNKALERQEKARFHRIGQTRETHWFRMQARGSIEEYVMKVCHRKDEMDANIRAGRGTGARNGPNRETMSAFLNERRKAIRRAQHEAQFAAKFKAAAAAVSSNVEIKE